MLFDHDELIHVNSFLRYVIAVCANNERDRDVAKCIAQSLDFSL